MNYRELMVQYWRERRLLSLMLELTYACDLRCAFCYNEKERGGRRLDLGKYDELLRDGRREGALFVTLTGGEPTLHPSFFDIGRMATEIGYSVRVKTNGYALTPAMIERIRNEIRPFNIDVSLHGALPETHDGVTGVRGSFERAVRVIRDLKLQEIRVRIKCPLTRFNEQEMPKLFDLAATLGVGLDSVPEISPTDAGGLDPLVYSPTPEGIRIWYRLIAKLDQAGETTFLSEEETDREVRTDDLPYACGAGILHLTVDPFGEVYPCVAWRRSLGSLWEASLSEIWHSVPADGVATLNREAGKRKALVPCLEGELFCPGRAEAQYGSPLTIYPEAVKIASIRKEVLSEFRIKENRNGSEEDV